MSDNFYPITSDIWGLFWTLLPTLKSDVIYGRSHTEMFQSDKSTKKISLIFDIENCATKVSFEYQIVVPILILSNVQDSIIVSSSGKVY